MPRGTGQTTNAMLAAPQGAVYVAANYPQVRYCRDLAAHLGRKDLLVVEFNYHDLRNRAIGTNRHVIIDHAAFDMRFPAGEVERICEFAKIHNSRLLPATPRQSPVISPQA